MATIKVKPWGNEQGDFVLIDEGDFDQEKHQLLGAVDNSGDSNTAKEKSKNVKPQEPLSQ